MIEIERTENSKIYEQVQETPREYSIEGMIIKAGSRDITDQQGQYRLDARTGPMHFKENYLDSDPQLDIDTTYYTDEGEYYLYSKLLNIVKIYKNICKYEIQNRQNRDHISTVELISINGNDVTHQINDEEFYFYPRIHPYRIGIWKELKQERTSDTIFKQKITEVGSGGIYEMIHKENIEAYDDSNELIPIQSVKTQINANLYYIEEIVPKEAKLVDTDFQVNAGSNDGYWFSNIAFNNSSGTFYIGHPNQSSVYNSFLRWTNINIPRGSIINTAHLQLMPYTVSQQYSTFVQYYMNAEDNPPAPTSATECSNLAQTTTGTSESLMYNNNQFFEQQHQTPSIVNPVQEIVNRSGWNSGNAMMVGLLGHAAQLYGSCEGCTYNYYISAYAPYLTIVQTEYSQNNKIIGVIPKNVIGIPKSSIKRIYRI